MSSVIKVNDVHRKFKVYYDKGRSLKDKILFKNRNRYEERWVLNGISFEVEKGEAVGLIGVNGCGKSTLLKLMTRILYPDQGSIEIEGRVSSLIELGAGFHPDMSGRENIYTNASIFGLTRKEIDDRLQDIIDFSELEEFIDNPVRTYSSGMYMRLAFSVAINVDAEILLIDEILAVGDANFQVKCFERLRELKNKGMTIVLVTHDSNTIEKFCNKAIWIKEGRIEEIGKSSHVIDKYLAYMNTKRIESMQAAELVKQKREEEKERQEQERQEQERQEQERQEKERQEQERQEQERQEKERQEKEKQEQEDESKIDYSANRFGYKHIEIYKAQFRNHENNITTILKAGKPAEIEIFYKVNKPLDEYVFGMGFLTLEGVSIIGCNTQLDRLVVKDVNVGDEGVVRFKIKNLNLLTGVYVLNVAVVDKDGVPMDFYRDYCHFNVISDDRSVGIVSFDHEWLI